MAPRIFDAAPKLILGMRDRIQPSAKHAIGQLWMRFGPLIYPHKGRADSVSYGLAFMSPPDGGPGFDYVAGVEVKTAEDAPAGMISLTLPAGAFAAFAHEGDVTNIRDTVDRAAHDWLPTSGYEHANAGGGGFPDLIEYYGPAFDPAKGRGDMEIWFPIRRKADAA